MASKLGTVLEIEVVESYIKRPAGPMVTVEVQDISRLAGFIRIPSMAEGAPTTNSVRQRILYSGLPNQCKKCRQFGHHARACNVILPRQRESFQQPIPPQGVNKGQAMEVSGAARTRGARSQASAPPNPSGKKGENARAESKGASPLLPPRHAQPQPAQCNSSRSESSELEFNQRRPPGNELRDLEILDPPKSPTCHKGIAKPSPKLETDDARTPNAKLQFGFQDLTEPQTSSMEARANPFPAPMGV
ncbi:unnamed protein product [Sphagnum tenellum]